jgi:hypothetical protein
MFDIFEYSKIASKGITMKQRHYRAVASGLLAVLLVLAAPAEGSGIASAVERPESDASNEPNPDLPGDTRVAEIGGSTVFWVLGSGLIVVSLVARRRSAGLRFPPWRR